MTWIKPDDEPIALFLKRVTAWTLEDEYEAWLIRRYQWRSIAE